jgi:hypothetical protein
MSAYVWAVRLAVAAALLLAALVVDGWKWETLLR